MGSGSRDITLNKLHILFYTFYYVDSQKKFNLLFYYIFIFYYFEIIFLGMNKKHNLIIFIIFDFL